MQSVPSLLVACAAATDTADILHATAPLVIGAVAGFVKLCLGCYCFGFASSVDASAACHRILCSKWHVEIVVQCY